MERLDFASLARAVDAPMNRWWKRTGWLWLLIPLAAIICNIALELYPRTATVSIYQAPLGYKLLAGANETLELIAWPSLLLLWLAAAHSACHSFMMLVREANAAGEGRFRQFSFLIGMRQGWIPLLTAFTYIAALNLAVSLIHTAPQPRVDLPDFATLLLAFNFSFGSLIHLAMAACWLLALRVAADRYRALPWLLAIGIFVLPHLSNTFLNAWNNSSVLAVLDSGSRPIYSGIALYGPSVMFYLGCLATIAMIWAFCSRRMVIAWISYGFLIAGTAVNAVSSLMLIDTHGRMGEPDYGAFQLISEIGKSIGIFGFSPVQAIFSISRTGSSMAFIALPHYQLKLVDFNLPLWEAVYIMSGLIWLALVVWFIHSVLLRPLKGDSQTNKE